MPWFAKRAAHRVPAGNGTRSDRMNGVLLQDALLALLILSILCALLNQGMRVYEKASQIGIEAIDTQWFYDDGGAVGAAGCERLPASGDGVFAGGAKACRRAGRHPARIHDFAAATFCGPGHDARGGKRADRAGGAPRAVYDRAGWKPAREAGRL